jgi:hypothetical protein
MRLAEFGIQSERPFWRRTSHISKELFSLSVARETGRVRPFSPLCPMEAGVADYIWSLEEIVGWIK